MYRKASDENAAPLFAARMSIIKERLLKRARLGNTGRRSDFSWRASANGQFHSRAEAVPTEMKATYRVDRSEAMDGVVLVPAAPQERLSTKTDTGHRAC